ncbi:hypothetical protein [Pantanalinema sp. GBBB05]|uniref:hypothetical protein n=1 Tax=Pantanalinema sp. GBBB05 TaxID=2604139 RepID=UPI001E14D4DB|nr:hypothetical protein [Pantanalinema sp. GBBB05]
MTADFTLEELKAIAAAPMLAGLTVSMIDLGLISTIPEIAALSKEMAGAAKKYPHNSIIQAVFSEAAIKEGSVKLEQPDIKAEDVESGALIEQAIEAITVALDVLKDRVPVEEVNEYKGFIYTCAEAVAQAAGSGIFGTGIKVSAKESAALERLKAVLAV